jgi:hypothetical protein
LETERFKESCRKREMPLFKEEENEILMKYKDTYKWMYIFLKKYLFTH